MGSVVIEPIDVRSIGNRLAEINFLTIARPVPTQMPFANHARVVTGLLHQVTQSWSLGRNQVGAGSTQYAFRESGSPVVSPGEKPVSRGCADRTRSVGVKKGQPFIRHLLQMGCFDFALRVGGRDVTDPEIIRHDQDDVGR